MSDIVPFFSIIIPVYNGLSHDLPICLDSIWNQPIDTSLYEVICVDDCSMDDTRQWLKDQQRLHDNLIVIENEENIRQGGARNRGVAKARGSYIMFIDQDDYYHFDGIKKVYEVLKDKDLDVLVNDSAYEYKGHYTEKLQLNFEYKEVCLGKDFIGYNGWPVAPWRFVIKREYYSEYNFIFESGCRIEDIDWSLKILFNARTVLYKGILLIHYIQGEMSTTDTMYKHKDILVDAIKASNRALSLTKELSLDSVTNNKIKSYISVIYNNSCKYMFGLFLPINDKVKIIELIPDIEIVQTCVKCAKQFPKFYSFISNLFVPFFRIIRLLYRFYKRRIKYAK